MTITTLYQLTPTGNTCQKCGDDTDPQLTYIKPTKTRPTEGIQVRCGTCGWPKPTLDPCADAVGKP